ncbi:ornithine cyclodeaminase family protein [Blastococcus sp. Marseille-P5729]|uniref:ornithine cyclodeaminase family protein n=1 Tax=Blastococcus sp. Marseille-P5729 TaxID=2086582 RepID=UPI000D0F9212|nr:ornithine cyclodeaminase family protein [Blastococcus sp. Marseille-P5729]
MARLLNDDDIRDALTPQLAMDAVRGVIAGFAKGEVAAPARVTADLADGVMTYTTGATPEVYGYRSYDSLAPGKVDQIVTCLDRATRRLKYVHAGSLVGIARTGAIGGVAVDALAAPQASTLTLIGSGIQAYWQAWAIQAIRPLRKVRVYSPTPDHRVAFARRLADRLDLPAKAMADPHEAVDGADIVVLATTAREPVIDTGWLADGAHVSSLGSKVPGSSEYDDRLLAESFITTDSLAQLEALAGSTQGAEHLGHHLRQGADRLHGKRFTFFQSCGLAGTEVALLDALGRALA